MAAHTERAPSSFETPTFGRLLRMRASKPPASADASPIRKINPPA
jgi:hypothetical protein